jgi:predicted dehydrogenase
MKPLRVGLVGSGWAAGAHVGAHNRIDDCEVVAMCTSRDPAPDGFADRNGRPLDVVRDYAELLARPDIDVIDLCSRSDLHAAQAIAAAQAGKHLIIEKPIGLTLPEMRAVEDAVAAAGVRTCVCLQVRFGQQFTVTKGLVDGDLIGPVHYAEVDYNHHIGPEVGQYEWNLRRAGGGSTLLTAGCHALDGLLLFLGNDIVDVTSYETRSPHPAFARYEYATSSVTILRYAGGAIAKVASVIDSHQPYYLRVYLVGRDGTILDGKLWSDRITGLDPDRWTELGVKLESVIEDIDDAYTPQFQEFYDAVNGGREMARTSLADAVQTFEVVFAADRSAAEGRPVAMSEIRR